MPTKMAAFINRLGVADSVTVNYHQHVSLNRCLFPDGPRSASILPDISPATTVDVTGDFLSLIRARKEKSRPSRAMAKMIRGSGNMEPSRLGGRAEQQHWRSEEGRRRSEGRLA